MEYKYSKMVIDIIKANKSNQLAFFQVTDICPYNVFFIWAHIHLI